MKSRGIRVSALLGISLAISYGCQNDQGDKATKDLESLNSAQIRSLTPDALVQIETSSQTAWYLDAALLSPKNCSVTTSWKDYSATKNNVTYIGGSATSCAQGFGLQGNAEPSNPNRFVLDGVNQHFESTVAGQLGVTNNLTIETWIKVPLAGHDSNYESLLSAGGMAIQHTYNGYNQYNRDSLLNFYWLDGPSSFSDIFGIVFQNDVWQYLAWVKNGANVTCYLNGAATPCVLETPITGTATPTIYDYGYPMSLGWNEYANQHPAWYANGGWRAEMAKFILHKKALTAKDISDHCALNAPRFDGFTCN